jgi:pilus assembly protein Flp/PilA
MERLQANTVRSPAVVGRTADMSAVRVAEHRPFADYIEGVAACSLMPAGDEGSPKFGRVRTHHPKGNLMYFALTIIAALHNRIETAKDRGATATEYAMLVAFIAIAIAVAVTAFGGQLSSFFTSLGEKIGIVKATPAS